jgi:collagenase-like PrtC family protease
MEIKKSTSQIAKLSLAPLAYYWDKQKLLSFYAQVMDWPVDIVYLGEVTCSRRHEMRLEDWLGLAQELRHAGKEVVLSSLVLIDNQNDMRHMHKLIDQATQLGFLIEANDLSAVRAMRGQAFVAGPHLNIYHSGSLAWFASLGAIRFQPPVEMCAKDIAILQAERPSAMQTEIQVWGKMALAFSARCFTARHHRLNKDSCEFRCQDYPEGLPMDSRDGSSFLMLNGIQTQSASCVDLGAYIPQLSQLNVEVLRLHIQEHGMEQVVQHFDQARQLQQAAHVPNNLLPKASERSNGYWNNQAGKQWHS